MRPKKPLAPLMGFENINRYWDNKRQKFIAKVLPGEYYVTKHSELISTTLGSCIAACIRDVRNNIGGMNHFLLPINNQADINWAKSSTDQATRYGNWAMEHLINDILRIGKGERKHLEIKVFGGGAVLDSFEFTNIGERNIQFIYRYLSSEGMPVLAQDVGGVHGRMVYYNPITGEAKVKKLGTETKQTILKEEQTYIKDIKSKPTEGDIELF